MQVGQNIHSLALNLVRVGSVENGKEIFLQNISCMCPDFQRLYVIMGTMCYLSVDLPFIPCDSGKAPPPRGVWGYASPENFGI